MLLGSNATAITLRDAYRLSVCLLSHFRLRGAGAVRASARVRVQCGVQCVRGERAEEAGAVRQCSVQRRCVWCVRCGAKETVVRVGRVCVCVGRVQCACAVCVRARGVQELSNNVTLHKKAGVVVEAHMAERDERDTEGGME